MRKWIKKLWTEVAYNGKLLVGWAMTQIPGISDYPGLVTAVNEFLANPSAENTTNLLIQAFLAGAAGHRLLKILAKVL